ncbi:MAG: VRR-NUC domain-containing protein [Bacteroidota bacterium]
MIEDLFKGGKRQKGKGVQAEHHLQSACVRWFRLQYPKLANLLISIPNGVKLSNGKKAWGKLKAEGAVAGASDLLLLRSNGKYGYLAIEMKTEKGRQSKSQKVFEQAVNGHGNGLYVIARSYEEFRVHITEYLNIQTLSNGRGQG